MKYSLYKQASVIINQFLEKKGEDFSKEVPPPAQSEPFQFPGQNISRQDTVAKQDGMRGITRQPGTLGTIINTGMKAVLDPLIVADAHGHLSDLNSLKYNAENYINAAKASGLYGKLFNGVFNGIFAPAELMKAIHHASEARNTKNDTPARLVHAANTGISGGTSLAAAGNLLQLSPRLASIATKLPIIRLAAKATPLMTPLLAADLALEAGWYARNRLMNGAKVLNPENQQSVKTLNNISKRVNDNIDQGELVPSMHETAPATNYYVNRLTYRAAGHEPTKIPTVWEAWKNNPFGYFNPSSWTRNSISPGLQDRVQEHIEKNDRDFPSYRVLKKDPNERKIVPKAVSGKNIRKEVVDPEGHTGAQVYSEAASDAFNDSRQFTQGPVRDAWKAGKEIIIPNAESRRDSSHDYESGPVGIGAF